VLVAGRRHTIHIRRPVEDVFAVLTNVELTARWYPLMEAGEL
jgi:uncharacterized protein YndB with AHSA1/START domain